MTQVKSGGGFLSRLEEKIGLADPKLKWHEAMINRAIELGINNFLASFLFKRDKWEQIEKLDYLYLLVRVYGFFTVMKMLKNGLGFIWRKLKFNSKMRGIEKRNLAKM